MDPAGRRRGDEGEMTVYLLLAAAVLACLGMMTLAGQVMRDPSPAMDPERGAAIRPGRRAQIHLGDRPSDSPPQ